MSVNKLPGSQVPQGAESEVSSDMIASDPAPSDAPADAMYGQVPEMEAPAAPVRTAPRANAIELDHITHAFDENTGVFDLTFAVPEGTICGMIGPSGCGKTTTVRLMTGLLKPDQGYIRVLDQEPVRFSAKTRTRIGYMPQQFVLYPDLTVWENLSFAASLYGMGYLKRRQPMREILEFVELIDAKNRLGSKLSGGMQRRLELACALVHNPELIFADEPTAGIDPVLRNKFWDYFRNLRNQGRTLFVTTQYVGEAAYCDYVCVMRNGRILDFDTPENLRRKAMGGDVIRLEVDPNMRREASLLLDSDPNVNYVRRGPQGPGMLYVYSDDAGTTLPVLLNLMSRHSIPVMKAEEYTPSFDDVFVRLMEQAEQTNV